jgi:CHAT domain-containing protein
MRATFLILSILGLLAAPVRADPPPTGPFLDEAFRVAQAAMASQAGNALMQIGVRAAAGTGELAALMRDRQALANALDEVEDRLALPDADTVILTGQADALNQQLAGIDGQVAAKFPEFRALTRPRPMSVAEVQAQLAPDEALILTYVGDNSTYVFAVSPTASGWHRLSVSRAEMVKTVSALRAELDPTGSPARTAEALEPVAPARPAFDRYLASLLYEYLLVPVMPVFQGARHVYIVPDGPLTSLPFGLLVTRYTDGADDDPAVLRATKWMIRDHALTTLPSVESLRVVRALPTPRPDRVAFAGFGDPVLEGGLGLASLSRGAGLMRAGLADGDQLRALAPLPQTRTELLRIAQTLGAEDSSVRLGSRATETAVKDADLSRARVVAFATHGLLSGDIAGLAEPALVLTPPGTPSVADDGLLTASEIADLKLDADWVLLSACNTAGGAEPGAEGLSGLARAFLFAGARSIMVSHWPVRDDAAARLTTVALDRLETGQARGRAEALQQSMLALMDDTRDPTLAHPSAWAPFVLVGEGG